MVGGRGVGRMEWSGGGEWDNCNSIINKYIKKRKQNKTKNIYKFKKKRVGKDALL